MRYAPTKKYNAVAGILRGFDLNQPAAFSVISHTIAAYLTFREIGELAILMERAGVPLVHQEHEALPEGV